MPPFGITVTDAIWKELRAHAALTTVTLTQVGAPVIDVTTGAITHPTTTDPVAALLAPYRREEVDGVQITRADQRVLFPKSEAAMDPTVASTITIAGVTWDIIDVREINNGGAWEVQVRRVGDV